MEINEQEGEGRREKETIGQHITACLDAGFCESLAGLSCTTIPKPGRIPPSACFQG